MSPKRKIANFSQDPKVTVRGKNYGALTTDEIFGLEEIEDSIESEDFYAKPEEHSTCMADIFHEAMVNVSEVEKSSFSLSFTSEFTKSDGFQAKTKSLNFNGNSSVIEDSFACSENKQFEIMDDSTKVQYCEKRLNVNRQSELREISECNDPFFSLRKCNLWEREYK